MPSIEKVRVNKDGTRWTRIQWYVDSVRQTPITVRADNQRDLDEMVEAEVGRLTHAIYLQKTLRGGDALAVGEAMTGADLVRKWLELYVAVELTGDTPEDYAVDAADYFVPFWGDVVISQATAGLGLEWRKWLLDKVRASGNSRLGEYEQAGYQRVNRLLTMGRSVFSFAVKLGWISADQHPLRAVKDLPYIPPETTHNFLFEPALAEAIRLVIARLKPEHDADELLKMQSRLMVSCFTYLALRQQDVYDSEWWQVMNDDGTVRDYFIVPRRISGSGRKSEAAEREAPIPEQVKEEFLALYEARGYPPLQGALIFPNQEGGIYVRQNWQRDFWRPALALARCLRVETVRVGRRDESGKAARDADGTPLVEEKPRFYDIPASKGLGPHLGRRCGVHMWGLAGFMEHEVLDAIGHNQREKKTLIRFYSKGKKQMRRNKTFVSLEDQVAQVRSIYSSAEAIGESERVVAEARAEIGVGQRVRRASRRAAKRNAV